MVGHTAWTVKYSAQQTPCLVPSLVNVVALGAKRSLGHLACTADLWGALLKSPSGVQAPAGRRKRKCDLQLSLFVRWHSPAGKTKVTRLQLRSVGSVDCLQVRRNLCLRLPG